MCWISKKKLTKDPKKFWSFVNGRKGCQYYQNREIHDPQDNVNTFADFFKYTFFPSVSSDNNTVCPHGSVFLLN